MLSYVSFILAFALVASGSDILQGSWRYEGQFVVGNPRLNWDKAGWKLVIPHVQIKQVVTSGKEHLAVHFVNPHIRSLNDRLPEKVTWTQMENINWLKTSMASLKRPFQIRFENDTVKAIVCDKEEIKDSIDMKLAFADHLTSALLSKEGVHKTHSIMGACSTKVERQPIIKSGSTKVASITYYHSCENSKFPIVGVLPIKPRCVDCQSTKRRLPLDSYNKVEVVRDGERIMSILRQNVIALPMYKIDSPVYSIYGNMSLIRVAPLRPEPVAVSSKERITVVIKDLTSHNDIIFEPKEVSFGNIQEAVKLVRAILSENGKSEKEVNILALHDLLSASRWLIKSIEKHLVTEAERNVFYSLIASQESHYALEVLMIATKSGRIPINYVPVFMILSCKVSDMTDFTAIHEFIQFVKQRCHLCATVSSLAMSVLVRRNVRDINMIKKHLVSDDMRLELALAGNLGLNKKIEILTHNVITKMAYVQSKRNPIIAARWEVIEELVKMFLNNKETTIVRAECFKVLIGLSCNKSIWSTMFAELNTITDPVLISYVISYMESFASNKLPFYKIMVEQIRAQIPLLKAKQPELFETLLTKHITLSAYSAESNMGVAILADYIIPKIEEHKYMTASLEIQPYVMNTLLSVIKVQVIAPVQEVKSLIKIVTEWKLKDARNVEELIKLSPRIWAILKKCEVKIFTDDMEILYLNAESRLDSFIRPILSYIKSADRIRGVVIPVTIKKYVHSLIGPHVEMSIVNYITMDSWYEMIDSNTFSIIPRMSAGLRLRLQADDKITINAGTEIKAKIEARNITISVRKTESLMHVTTFLPLQIAPMVTLEVIPTTGSKLGCPKRVFDKISTPSLEVKSVPISWITSLDDPSVVLNISGKIEKPVSSGWLYALQEPQYIQLSLLPTYDLPSDTIVTEWIHSERSCPALSYCLLKNEQIVKPVKRCQRFCINSVLSNDTIATEGSAITILQKDVKETLEVVVDSRIKWANRSKLGLFRAEASLWYPSLVKTADLLDKTYMSELKQHKFISLLPMQLTLNETEMTRQIHNVISGVFLPVSRTEDYTDMNRHILNLFPELYIKDTLKIEGLHRVFKTLLNISTRALEAKSQEYEPNWVELESVKGTLLEILKGTLKKETPETVVMQDHVILWCLMQYFEIGYDYLNACNSCNKAKQFIVEFKTTIFPKYVGFYGRSKQVVIDALKTSSKGTMDVLVSTIYNIDDILIKIVQSSEKDPITSFYKRLNLALTDLTSKMHALSLKELMLSKSVMTKITGFEMLKSIADHWHFDGDVITKEQVKRDTMKTDMGVSFMSVAARFVIQACKLLGENPMYEGLKFNELLSQAITLLDYNRWLRTCVIDGTELPHLKTVTVNLMKKTKATMQILKDLPSSITLDPMVQIFITEVIALHRLTILELKKIPTYALYGGENIKVEELEWDLIVLMKKMFASYRPLSTLKRGILKYPTRDYLLQAPMIPSTPRRVTLKVSIVWPEVKMDVTVIAKKSDSQVINELQQPTLTRTESMARSLTRMLLSRSCLLDPLMWELNIYRDICAMVAVEGTVPEEIKIELAKLSEIVKVTLFPFETPLSREDTEAVRVECPGNKCIRALISRDSRKIDILMKDPIENTLLLQVPIRMW